MTGYNENEFTESIQLTSALLCFQNQDRYLYLIRSFLEKELNAEELIDEFFEIDEEYDCLFDIREKFQNDTQFRQILMTRLKKYQNHTKIIKFWEFRNEIMDKFCEFEPNSEIFNDEFDINEIQLRNYLKTILPEMEKCCN